MSDQISTFDEVEEGPKLITATQARRAAKWFNYGTLVSLVMPLPLMIFWAGLSMLIYALNKHHPNPKVGEYTQQAAYRFYGIAGSTIVFGTFFPPKISYYLVLWVICAVILVPWSLYDLRRINRDQWEDTVIVADPLLVEDE